MTRHLHKVPRKSLSTPAHQQRQSAPAPARRRYRPGTIAIREIRKYQRGTNLLLRKLPFQRLVRELFQKLFAVPGQRIRWQASALEALQVAAEDYLIHLFEDAYDTHSCLTTSLSHFPSPS